MNNVTLLIDGEDFEFWSSVEISRPIDSVSTFSLSVPFDPDVPLLRETFEPFSYKPVVLAVDGETLLTGTLFISPRLDPSSNVVSCSGYSKPGALNDCEFPADAYPLEFNDVNLQTIAEKAAQPFGIDVIFRSPPGTNFQQVKPDPGTKILSFLVELAKQRGLLISDTPEGALLFYKPVESSVSVAAIHQAQDRFISGTPAFNEQQYFSAVTGFSPTAIGLPADKFTVENTAAAGVFRPHTFKIKDTTDVDIQDTVRAKIGRMFADAVAYEVTLQGWRDDAGDIWAPDNIIKLTAPGIMVYNEYEFIVRSVRLARASQGGDTGTLGLALPGAYNGKIPEALPWER
jgi:prophage tail gpP-like protein